MKFTLILMELMLITLGDSLVHYKKLQPGAKGGCKGPKGDIPLYETQDDDEVCGAYHCQSNNGDALIHYCQRPVPFAECKETGVSSKTHWPDCCWMCVNLIFCKKQDDVGPKDDSIP